MRNEYFTKLHGQNIGDPVQEKYRAGKVSSIYVIQIGPLAHAGVSVKFFRSRFRVVGFRQRACLAARDI